MKRCFPLFLTVGILIVSSCGNTSGNKDVSCSAHLPLVEAPSMLEGAEKMEYIAEHFWDAFTSTSRRMPSKDSTVVSGVQVKELEQAMSNWVVVLGNLPLDKARKCVKRFAERLCAVQLADTTSNMLKVLGGLGESYMYDPNSPYRDEDIYQAYAQTMSCSELFSVTRRETFAQEARMCDLNRRGSAAADFRFCDRNGKTRSLYSVKADNTVLFFSNPGCTACKEIINTLSTDQLVSSLISSGSIAVLNIYIDEDLAEWYNYMPIYPEIWYNGYDPDHIIRDDELYNVRAIPSLYLLDSEKKVLLKDATVEKMMNRLYELYSDQLPQQ